MTIQAQQILVPVDFSTYSRDALREADALASARDGELTLLFVHKPAGVEVMDFQYPEPQEMLDKLYEAARKHMRIWTDALTTPPGRLHYLVESGDPVEQIVEHSSAFDLIVMATHGYTGMKHFRLGSVTERVIRGANCSILVVKSKQ